MKFKIAILPGDGIGPEVIEQALKVLKAVSEKYNHHFNLCFAEVGAAAIDAYGDPYPDDTHHTCLNADAILFGAIGHPKYDNDPNAKVRPEQGLLRMRKLLSLFANIRPIQSYNSLIHLSPFKTEHIKNVDVAIYRELTGGIYFGEKGKSEDGTQAYDHCTYTQFEIQRIVREAFKAAQQRRNKLTLIDKANVMATSRLWRQEVQAISKEFPDVQVEYMFVDNAAYQIIYNPQQFDVIVTSNLFGDIISDEASILAGSLGMLPSASLGTETALFEPIHGSYPQAAGKDIANPIATILSTAMMLDYLNLKDEATDVRRAVRLFLENGFGTPDLKPEKTVECSFAGELIAALVYDKHAEFKIKNIVDSLSTII
ncbi:MAG: 3-isopropylmalate dehydrogenase, partial [Bacteroidota bacterium]